MLRAGRIGVLTCAKEMEYGKLRKEMIADFFGAYQ